MPATAKTPPHYRPELDGLRAVAVLGVILFHLHAPWLPGGFAGVDVFFVLSGYLVTSVILREWLKGGKLSYARFYQHRIARIFPAFLLMTTVTLAAAAAVYSTWDLASTASALSAALASIANYHQLSLGNYFQLSADSQPLLHCWSLSVEEQFYILFPLVITTIMRLPANGRLPALSAITLASFLWNLHCTDSHPINAFYLLPSRAWELLAGSLLALAQSPHCLPAWAQRPPPPAHHSAPHPSLDPSPGALVPGTYPPFPDPPAPHATAAHPPTNHVWNATSLAAPLGLAGILLSFFVLGESQPFPGWRALLPVLATLAIIHGSTAGRVRALLAAPIAVRIGVLSYSLYLWHWPAFSVIDYTFPYQSHATRLFLKILLTIACATACHHWVEKPARRWLNLPRHRLTAFLGLAIALLLLIPLGHRISARHYLDASTTDSGILTFPAHGATRTLLLMGDSQGTMYAQLVRDLADAHHLTPVIVSKAGEDPLAFFAGPPTGLHLRTLQTVRDLKPDIVILACHWIYKLEADPGRLALTLRLLQPHARRIILLTQPPLLPPTAERSAIRNGSQPPFFEAAADRERRLRCNQTVKQMSGPGVEVLDLESLFTHPDGSLRTTTPSGRPVFHDRVHLSADGADLLIPWLAPLLSPPAPPAPPPSPP